MRPKMDRPVVVMRSLRPLQSFPTLWKRAQNRQNDGPAARLSPQIVYTMLPVEVSQTLKNAR
jgi:hypothetical protein